MGDEREVKLMGIDPVALYNCQINHKPIKPSLNINGEMSTKFFAVKLYTRMIVKRCIVKKYND